MAEQQPAFQILAWNGDSVRIEADNWLAAMGRALVFFQGDPEAVGSLVVTPADDGAFLVEETSPAPGAPLSLRRSWAVRRAREVVAVVARGTRLEDPEPGRPTEPAEEEALPDVRPPTLQMPVRSSLAREAPPERISLAEKLFDRSMDLAAAEPDEACRLAMELVLELVPAEAASVARESEEGLRYVAASGPVSERILGSVVPYGVGLAGQCHDLRATLVVNDVTVDRRHLRAFDQDTGYTTRASLCVPIVDDERLGLGVLQVLNPAAGTFGPEAVEVVETVAKTLAQALQGA